MSRGIPFLGYAILGASIFLSCTQKDSQSEALSPETRFLFSFDPQSVLTLEIAKSDPQSGDAWSARVTRNSTSDSWLIASGNGSTLIDRKAANLFIAHLLDTLRTLQPTEKARSGPLGAFGLSPPHFAIRWAGNEVHLGAPADSGAVYGRIQGKDNPDQVYVMRGAALQMLSHLNSFDALRLRTLTLFQSDDIDEIELRKGKKTFFYAQREGEVWTNKGHKPYSIDVGKLLDRLTHARIKEFIDHPELNQELNHKLEKQPSYEAVLIPRKGSAERLRFQWNDSRQLIATTSARKGAAFQVYPEILGIFQQTP